MKAELVRIGNSRGIRIPKPLIEQCGLSSGVELKVKGRTLLVEAASAPRKPRQGWSSAFAAMARHGDDQPLLSETARHGWDEAEWTW